MKKDVIYNSFRAGLAWILLVIGIGLYAVGFFVFEKDNLFRDISLKIADVLVIGVLMGFLSNAAQFFDVFKHDLEDLLYGKEFIKKRKDVYQVWETVSKELFKNRFPAIHKDFLKAISNYFPTKDEINYYDDYESSTIVEWVNEYTGDIKVNTIQSFDIITDSDNSMVFPLKTWTRVKDPDNYHSKVLFFRVNGKTIEPEKDSSDEEKDYNESEIVNKIETFNYKFEGNKIYHVEYEIEKYYNIKTDFILGFRAKYIVNNYRVKINCPENILLSFTCRGTQEDFQDMNSRTHSLDKKYKGIILPRQGYLCAMQKK